MISVIWGSVAVLAVVRPARLQVRPVTREVSHPVSLATRREPGTFQGKKALDGLYVTPVSHLSLFLTKKGTRGAVARL